MHNDNQKTLEMTDEELMDMMGGFHFFDKKRHRKRPPATTKYGVIPSATATPTPMPTATPTIRPTMKYGIVTMDYGVWPSK